MSRLASIFFAYVGSTVAGTFALMVMFAALGIFTESSYVWHDVEVLLEIGLPIAFFTGWIVALPLIVLGETQTRLGSGWERDWKAYTLAGSLYAIVLFVISGGSSWGMLALFGPSTAFAGFSYWLIAWRLLPPSKSEG